MGWAREVCLTAKEPSGIQSTLDILRGCLAGMGRVLVFFRQKKNPYQLLIGNILNKIIIILAEPLTLIHLSYYRPFHQSYTLL